MSLGGQIFGLRVAGLLPAFTLPFLKGTSGLAAFAWEFVTRYRSATVADSHGLPWIRRGKNYLYPESPEFNGQSWAWIMLKIKMKWARDPAPKPSK